MTLDEAISLTAYCIHRHPDLQDRIMPTLTRLVTEREQRNVIRNVVQNVVQFGAKTLENSTALLK